MNLIPPEEMEILKDCIKFACIVIFILFSLSMIELYDTKHPMPTRSVYDTVYVVSRYHYFVIDDSTLRKTIINDTVHSVDTILPEFPVETVRVLRIDTIH